MLKSILVTLLMICVSCGKSTVDSSCVQNCESKNSNSLIPSPMILSNFQTSNLAYDGFEVSYSIFGDENQNGEVIIYYCSVKDTAVCDPETDGISSYLTREGSNLSGLIDLSQQPFTSGDIVKYKIIASDVDGITGGNEGGYVIVPYDGQPRAISQLGFITMGVDSSGNENVTASVVDSSGNLFVGGYTNGSLGEANGGNEDAFIAKFNSSGVHQWTSQLGIFTVGKAAAAGSDIVNSITIDEDGFIYIGGNTNGSLGEANGGSEDAFIAKFNSSGVHQWTSQLGNITIGTGASGSDYVYGIAIDNDKNIFIGGYTNGDLGETNSGVNDAFIAKFNSSGLHQWTSQLGNVTVGVGASGNEYLKGIVVDSLGNIFLGGNTNGALGETNGGNFDAFISKFNSSGLHQWTSQLGNVTSPGKSSENESVLGIAIDTSGNILIGGYTDGSLGETNGGSTDAFAVKFDSDGSHQWTSQLGALTVGAGASGTETVLNIALDSSGNIYLSGSTDGSLGEANGGSFDGYTTKINTTGVHQWTSQFGNVTIGSGASDNDSIHGVSIDSNGDILICGNTNGAVGEINGGANDFFSAKLNTSGVPQWIGQLGNVTVGGGAFGSEGVTGIAVDSSGNIFWTGNTNGSLGEATNGNSDIFISKFDANRNHLWTKQFGNTTAGAAASGNDTAMGLVLDSSGNIYIGGQTDGSLGETNGGNNDVFVAKFNASGVHQWTSQLGSVTAGVGAPGNDYASGMAIDSSGNVYVGGHTNGELGDTNNGNMDVFVAKFNSSGVHQWTSQIGGVTTGGTSSAHDFMKGMAVHSNGNIYVGGNTNGALGENNAGNDDIFIAKFNSSGVHQWTKQLGNTTVGAAAAGDDYIKRGFAIDSSENIYVGGQSSGALAETNGGIYDAVIVKFNSSGVLQWTRQLGSDTVGAGASGNENVKGLAIDSAGNILISGDTSGSLGETNAGSYDAYIAKFDPSGVHQWTKQLGNVTVGITASGYEDMFGLLIDNSDNIFITGSTYGDIGEINGGSSDAFMVKFDSSGNLSPPTE